MYIYMRGDYTVGGTQLQDRYFGESAKRKLLAPSSGTSFKMNSVLAWYSYQ